MTYWWLFILWFGAWGIVFLMIFLWRTAERLSQWKPRPRPNRPTKEELDRQKQELERRQRENETQEEAQRRREEARTACERLFVLHAPEIKDRFPRETFDGFVTKHLGDGRPVEYVERRAKDLQEIILDHLRKVVPEPSILAAEARTEARAAVQGCYDENADLLREAFPPVRFDAEMRVRLPDMVPAEEAWKQARDMIHELLVIVADEKIKQNRQKPPSRKIKPPSEKPPMHNI